MKRTLIALLALQATVFAQVAVPDGWKLDIWSTNTPSVMLQSTTFPRTAATCGLDPTLFPLSTGTPNITPTSSFVFTDPSSASAVCRIVFGTAIPTALGGYTLTLSSLYTSVSLPFTVAPPPAPPVIFVQDTFTGSVNTPLTAHNGQVGAMWRSHVPNNGNAPGTVLLTGAGGAQGGSLAKESLYYASGTPTSAEYVIEADFVVRSIIAGQYAALMGRIDGATLTYYDFVTDGVNWYMTQVVNGVFTTIATCPSAFATGQTYHVVFTLANLFKTATVAGRLCTTSGTNAITGIGKAGVAFYQQSGALPTPSTGIQIDNFVVHSIAQ